MSKEAVKIQEAIDAIKKNRPNYGQMLDLFGKIMIKQAEAVRHVKLKTPLITKEVARAKLKKGTPLLSRQDFEVDLNNASQLFAELCEILKSESSELDDEIGKIEDALKKGALSLDEVFRGMLKGSRRLSELAESLSLDSDILSMLVAASVRPSLEAAASRVRDAVEQVPWSKNYCPVCGSSPAISELRQVESSSLEGVTSEGAERIMYCSFCGTEWRAMRIACAFCGNTDFESLRYFYSEEDEAYRIDVCEKCKKYIKTVDSRNVTHEVVLPVEDMATLHLDIIAEEEGYKREAWLMPHYNI